MKRSLSLSLILLVALAAGCQKQHPSVIKIEPDFDPGKVSTILVIPTMSTITPGDDPARESEIMVDRVLWEHISQRGDYTFISPNSFRGAVGRAGIMVQMQEFIQTWIDERRLTPEFREAINLLNVDMILIPEIYLWNKDEADYRESATASATQVGMTISIIDPHSEKVMWEATDENYKEAVRTEGDRIQATTGGLDRAVSGRTASGKDMYAAPPFEDVTVLVVEALVTAIPEKVASTE